MFEKIIYQEESYAIQGAIFEVYREMGSGFLESVYQECLEMELKNRNIPFIAQPQLELSYKGEILNQKYRTDIICYSKIIVELKAVKEIAPEHEAQILNYLHATNLRLGLLVNFGSNSKVDVRRFAL